jgi:FixJ family two-component response regulator
MVHTVVSKAGKHPITHMSRSARVLIADDDPGTLATYAVILSEDGHSVLTASTARECVRQIHQQQIDIVVLDVRFGGVNGIRLLTRLRRAGIMIPIIVMTGFADVPTAVAALREGAVNFLEKAIHPSMLLRAISDSLESGVAGASDHLQRLTESTQVITPLLAAVRADIRQTLERLHVRRGEPQFVQGERDRTAALLLQACAVPQASVAEFMACARAARLVLDYRAGLTRHALFGARQSLRVAGSTFRAPTTLAALTVVDSLVSGPSEVLARSQADWATATGFHRSTISRTIHGETGATFASWRRVCRLKRAVQLLATTDEQAAQVAFESGFRYSQLSQFGREFRLMFSVTPLQCRSLIRLVSPG